MRRKFRECFICLRGTKAPIPKGYKDSARGFNPGTYSHQGPALPVRRSSENAGRRRKRTADKSFGISFGMQCGRFFSTAPLGRTFFNRYLGLKPQAKSLSPFGTNIMSAKIPLVANARASLLTVFYQSLAILSV